MYVSATRAYRLKALNNYSISFDSFREDPTNYSFGCKSYHRPNATLVFCSSWFDKVGVYTYGGLSNVHVEKCCMMELK